MTHAEVRPIILGLMLAMFLSALDQTIVATALPIIGRDLHDFANLSWIITAYLLAATAVTPLYGKLADIHGRRTVLLVSIGVFIAGSIACALSSSMPMLVTARTVQGLGGGGLIALSQTIIADIVTPKERSRYQAYFGVVFASANVTGAVLGGFFAQYLHWSLIFWVNLPLGLAALAMTYRTLARLPQVHRLHRLDILGALLMTSATVMMLLALTWGGTRYPWSSPTILGMLGAASVLWVLFALRLATAAEPFIALAVLRNPVVRNGTLVACFAFGTLIGLSIYVPVYFQIVMQLGAGRSGLALIPLLGGAIAGATFSGRTMAMVRHYKRLPLCGLSLGAACLAALAALPAPPPLVTALLLTLVGVGCGSAFPVTTVSVQNSVHPHQLGTATAMVNFFRQLGGAVLVAVFGAILLAGLDVGPGVRAAEILARAASGEANLAPAFRAVFFSAGGCLAAGVLFLLLMEERPLRDRFDHEE